MTKHQSLKALAVIAIATGIGRLMGFFREWIMATYFGTSAANDALVIALSLPDVILGIVTVSLSTALIPVFLDARVKQGETVAETYINNLLVMILGITTAVTVGVYSAAPLILKGMAGGFALATQDVSVSLLKICLPMIVLNGISAVYTGYLQAKLHFFIPAFISIPLNAIIITVTACGAIHWGINAVAWGYLGGTLLQTLIIWIAVRRYRLHFHCDFRQGRPWLIRTGILLLPVLVGSAVNQVSGLFANYLASELPTGSVSAYHFATRLILFPHNVFTMSLTTVAFPSLSQNIANHDLQAFKGNILRWLHVLLICVIPITVILVTMHQPIVAFVFEHGRFDRNSTQMTSQVLQLLAFSLPAFGMRELFNRIFFAVQDTVTPIMNGTVTMLINITFNLILVKRIGLNGLALSGSLATSITILFLFRKLVKNQYLQIRRRHLYQLGQCLLAAAAMIVAIEISTLWGAARISSGALLVKGISAGCIVYGLTVIWFHRNRVWVRPPKPVAAID